MRCEACGTDVPAHTLYGVDTEEIKLTSVCARCKARIERDIAEKDYYIAKKRKLQG